MLFLFEAADPRAQKRQKQRGDRKHQISPCKKDDASTAVVLCPWEVFRPRGEAEPQDQVRHDSYDATGEGFPTFSMRCTSGKFEDVVEPAIEIADARSADQQ